MTAAKLIVVWVWFTAQVFNAACLNMPSMRVGELDGLWGSYSPWFPGGRVTVEADAPRFAAVHEMAHHLFYACDIQNRPVGRRFLAASGHSSWDGPAIEGFAATLTWVLTGQGRQDIDRHAAWTLRPLIGDPSAAQEGRLGW